MFKKHFIQELSAYCQGELSPDRSRRVAEHLLRCRRCRKEYEAIKLGVSLVRRLAPATAPASLWSEIEAALDQPSEAMPSPRKNLWIPPLPLRLRFAAVAALFLIVLGLSATLYYFNPPAASWEVARLEGTPRIGSDDMKATGRMAVGEWLETDGASRAKIQVGQIGEVEIEPNTRVRLVQARMTEHRLALKRGTMHARIWAPPRLFFVETPSAVAVDLGCAYTLTVDDAGAGRLHVSSGWVAFERQGRESFVPAGALCETQPEIGPGTPYFEEASAAFRLALMKLDFETSPVEARSVTLRILLDEARRADALTLWHLLAREKDADRALVYDRLAQLVAPPGGVTRDGILQGDRRMFDLWWNELGLGDTRWWRIWKGPFPIKSR